MKTNSFSSIFKRNFLLATLLLVILGSIANVASSQTVTWAGPATGGDWATATNWSSGETPIATDSVLITSGNEVILSTDAGKINSLTVQGKLTVLPTGVLSIEQNVKSLALLNITGGEVDNTGTIVLTQKIANTVPGLALANGTTNSTFKNTGVLTINMSLTGAAGDCVTFKQNIGGIASFIVGGTMNFIPGATRNIFQNLYGNGQIDGNVVIGSPGDYKNARLLQINAGNFTLLENANIEFYGGLTNGALVKIQNIGTTIAASTSTLTNNGTLMIHANSAVTSNAIQFSPGAYATSTLTNTGTIIIDGEYSTQFGSIYFAGTDRTSYSVLNNLGGAVISATNSWGTPIYISNSSASGYAAIVAGNNINATVNNAGTISLNSNGRSIRFGSGLSTFNNNAGGIVTVTTGITGLNGNVTACNFYNNAGAIFDFNLPANPGVGSIVHAYNAIDNNGKILFVNNGGTVTGRGLFMTGLFIPSTGIIAPGNGNGTTPYGQIQINGTPLDFSKSTFSLKIGGKTAGVNYDQVLFGTPSAAINIADANLRLSLDPSYTPENLDSISLIKSNSSGVVINGNFAATNLPNNWGLNYTPTVFYLIHTTPNALQNINVLNVQILIVDRKIEVSLGDDVSAILKIMDLTGRTLIELPVKGKNNIVDTGNMKGVYIVKLKAQKGEYLQKISL